MPRKPSIVEELSQQLKCVVQLNHEELVEFEKEDRQKVKNNMVFHKWLELREEGFGDWGLEIINGTDGVRPRKVDPPKRGRKARRK